MEKNEVITLEDRGFIQVNGPEAKDFLQNIVTNDIEKVTSSSTVFSSILTPQGKYLFEFFVLKLKDSYLLECEKKSTVEIIKLLNFYKLRSKVDFINLSEKYVAAVISLEKFREISSSGLSKSNTVSYRDDPVYIDPRNDKLGAKIISKLENIHLTIKKLNLNKSNSSYLSFRPQHIYITNDQDYDLELKIFGIENLGKEIIIICEYGENKIRVIVENFTSQINDLVKLKIDRENILLF